MDNNRKTIGYIGGIPFMVDNDADEKAFASMFPQGAEFNGGNHPLEKVKEMGSNFNPVTDTPFGKRSIFYIPDMFLKSDFTFDETGEGTDPQVAARGFAPTNDPDPEPNSPIDLWVTFLSFDFEADLERFLSGYITPEYKKTIYEFLEDKASAMPKQMICAYVKKTAVSSLPVPVFRFSKGLCKYIESLVSGGGSIDLYERVDKWVTKLNQLGLQYNDFNYNSQQLEDAFEVALPHDINTSLGRMPKGTDTKEKKKKYNDNYALLKSMAENPSDPQTENAIRVLCKIAIELDTDVLQSYNQQADVRYNTAYPKRKLTANDFYHMARRLASLSKEIKKFQNGDFRTADDIISFINLNLVDPSALGEETKFVINYPFEKLSYQRRKEMMLLFLDGKRVLSFSGFWAGATWDGSRKISAGDIVYNLLITGSESDKIELVQELEKETKIFDLLNQADDNDFLFNITAIVANESLKQNPIANNPDLKGDLMKKGNFVYFDIALLKDQTENLEEKAKKIELVNNGVYNIAGEAADDFQKLIDEYKQKYSSIKTLFNPLELVVLFAEDDINTQVIKLKKGDSVILPACVVYLLFKEDTNRAVNFIVALTTTVIFLPFGVSGLIAAIRAANTLGIIVTATDIAVDAAYLTYSTPNVQNSDLREDLEWINAVAAIYGLARLSYALKDVKGVQLLKDIKAAISSLIKDGKLLLGSGGNLKYLKVISRNMAKQEHEMSCAAACIHQFAKDNGKLISEAEVRQLANTDEIWGTTESGLKKGFQDVFGKDKSICKIEFNPSTTDAAMAKQITNDGSWIAIIKPRGKPAHVIIVDKIVGNNVHIRDPWPLEKVFSEGKFGVEATVDLNSFSEAWALAQNWCFRLKK